MENDLPPHPEVIPEGVELIRSWVYAEREVRAWEDRARTAHAHVRQAEDKIIRWLKPTDAQPGEKIAIWLGDSLIQLEVGGVVTGEGTLLNRTCDRLTIRTHGKTLHRL